jgi:hypothetical protein
VVVCWLLECTISQLNLLKPATYLMFPRKVHPKATFYLRDFLLCKFVVKLDGFSVVRVARSSVFYVHILFYRSLLFLYLFLYAIVLSVLRFTNSDYPFGIFKHLFVLFSFFFLSLSCRSFFDLRILIIPMVSSNSSLSFSFMPLYCLSFDFRILIIPMVSSNSSLSVCNFSLGHCIVCPSLMYGFFFVLVVKIAGMKFCSLEIKQESIIHCFLTFFIGWPTFSDLNCKR